MPSDIREYLLPAPMIIKGFVPGDPYCCYEKYLLEFVNEMPFFRAKSGGDVFTAPISESQGECDCVSKTYQMDFKLIASKTMLQAKSIYSDSITPREYKGISFLAYGAPKATGKPMMGTRIHAALRRCNFEELFELRKNMSRKQGIENDIKELLITLETKKNLLLFFPYSFKFECECELDAAIEELVGALSTDFSIAMKYRKYIVPQYDTYFAFLYSGYIIFLEEMDGILRYIDKVNVAKSPVYMHLTQYNITL